MRRILSLLLTVVLVCGSLCSNVMATKAEIESDAEIHNFAVFLELLAGDTGELDFDSLDKKLTRLEFAEIVALMMNCRDRETNNVYFSDAMDSAAVNNLAARRIFVGDGELFHPERFVTIGETYAAVIRMLGYDIYTNQYGNNVAGYAGIAKRIGIYAEGSDVYGEATLKAVLGILLDATQVPLLQVSSVETASTSKDSLLNYEVYEERFILDEYHDIRIIKGMMTANRFTDLYVPEGFGKAIICIDNAEFYVEDTAVHDYIGQNVIAYAKTEPDSTRGEIICIFADEDKNESLEINLGDVESYSDYKLKYAKNNKSVEIAFNKDLAVIYNGKAVTGDYEKIIKKGIGTMRLYKNSKDNKYGVIVIEAYENYIVKNVGVVENIIYFEDSLTKSLDLGQNDVYYVFYAGNENEKINPRQIMPGELISVMVSQDSKLVKGFLSTEKASGRIRMIKQNVDSAEIVIDDKIYETAYGFTFPNGLAVGSFVECLLDVEGKIAHINITRDDVAVGFVYAGAKEEKPFDDVFKVKLFNEYGEHLVLELEENVIVDNQSCSSEKALAALCDAKSGFFEPQLVRYALNSKNHIRKLDLAQETKATAVAEEEGSLWEMTKGFSSNIYSTNQRMFMPRYPLSDETKIIVIPQIDSESLSDDTGFAVINYQTAAPFTNTSSYRTRFYKTNTATPFVDYVVYEDSATPTMWGKGATLAIVVDEISDVLAGDEVLKQMSGYSRGEKITLFVNSKLDVSNVSQGDVLQYVTNTRGEMANMIMLYDASAQKTDWTEYMSNKYGTLRMGDVFEVFEDPMNENQVAVALGVDETLKDYLVVNKSASVTVYDSERRAEKVYVSDINEIQNADFVETKQKLMVIKNSQFILEIILFK